MTANDNGDDNNNNDNSRFGFRFAAFHFAGAHWMFDRAGYYMATGLLIFMSKIGGWCGLHAESVNTSNAQDGKTEVDGHFGVLKMCIARQAASVALQRRKAREAAGAEAEAGGGGGSSVSS